jgi:hypothetical protein
MFAYGVLFDYVGLGNDGADQHISEMLIGDTMIRGPKEMHRNPHYTTCNALR